MSFFRLRSIRRSISPILAASSFTVINFSQRSNSEAGYPIYNSDDRQKPKKKTTSI